MLKERSIVQLREKFDGVSLFDLFLQTKKDIKHPDKGSNFTVCSSTHLEYLLIS